MERNQIIKYIWALSKELEIDKEDLYSILHRETKKESMKDCTNFQLKDVLDFLNLLKTSSNLQKTGATKEQISKIYALAYSLKWDKNPKVSIEKRINKYCKKVVKVESVNWLSSRQAYIVIEGLKKIKSKENIS